MLQQRISIQLTNVNDDGEKVHTFFPPMFLTWSFFSVTKSYSLLYSSLKPEPDAIRLDWIEQCFTSPPTQYRLYGRRFLQVK